MAIITAHDNSIRIDNRVSNRRSLNHININSIVSWNYPKNIIYEKKKG